MGEEAQLLYRSAVDAWVDLDLRLAASLPALDAALDALTADLYARLLWREPTVDRGAVVGLALVGRCYERAGDHAVNIGRRVVFTLTGTRPPEHASSRGQSA
jgi:phosphate transport system protein